jgi:hypothetical protein
MNTKGCALEGLGVLIVLLSTLVSHSTERVSKAHMVMQNNVRFEGRICTVFEMVVFPLKVRTPTL